MSSSNWKKLILLLIVFLLFLFLILFLFFFTFLLFSSWNNDNELFPTKSYQYMRVTPSRHATTFSTAKMSQNSIPSNDFLSYSIPNSGSTILIKEFGGESFSCEGSCFCKKNSRRRNTALTSSSLSLLTRGLTILLSAFSVSLAIKMSEESFEQHCHHEFSELCDPENVIVEVERCREENDPENFLDLIQALEFGDSGSYRWTNPRRKFQWRCRGQCSDNLNPGKTNEPGYIRNNAPDFIKPEYLEKWVKENGPCENLKLENHPVGFQDILFLKPLPNLYSLTIEELTKIAREDFSANHLYEYCRSVSEVHNVPHFGLDTPEAADWEVYSVSACTSQFEPDENIDLVCEYEFGPHVDVKDNPE